MTEKQQDQKQKLKYTAIEIALIPDAEISYFLKELYANLPDDKKRKFINKVAEFQLSAGGWYDAEVYMENCFNKNFSYTPKRVAHMCCKYRNLGYRMESQMIERAQRIKDKVRKRLIRCGMLEAAMSGDMR